MELEGAVEQGSGAGRVAHLQPRGTGCAERPAGVLGEAQGVTVAGRALPCRLLEVEADELVACDGVGCSLVQDGAACRRYGVVGGFMDERVREPVSLLVGGRRRRMLEQPQADV
jgi:hypothetical protein